jgi:hypothetical protein
MGLATALGLGLGFVLQKVPNSKFNTKWIPAVIAGLMFVKNLLIAAGKLPADAVLVDVAWLQSVFAVPEGVALAGWFGGWFGTVLQLVLQSLLDAALPVGLHSGIKNTRQAKALASKK